MFEWDEDTQIDFRNELEAKLGVRLLGDFNFELFWLFTDVYHDLDVDPQVDWRIIINDVDLIDLHNYHIDFAETK